MHKRGNSERLAARQRAEKRFRWYGVAALSGACMILVLILTSLFIQGYQGFWHSEIYIDVRADNDELDILPGDDVSEIPASSFQPLAKNALYRAFPDVTERAEKRDLSKLVSSYAGYKIQDKILRNPDLLGKAFPIWVKADSKVDLYLKGSPSMDVAEEDRAINDQQIAWIKQLKQRGDTRLVFSEDFFTEGDSRTPERAGFWGAMLGSLLTMLCCLTIVFPIGVMTAVYLEEFATRSRFTDWVEVNINNLAAVPSIVFGLLGLAVYINVLGLPRSAPIVGGLTLAMMILPVIIISTRVSIDAIPQAIRDAARGLGATNIQVVWHHVLPLAMPGIMTGTILGLARAIGETAPLIMIGMVAFIADLPMGIFDSATVMPVQIYLWASSPEAGFAEKTAAGIIVLLGVLLTLNALAIYLRKRLEVRW